MNIERLTARREAKKAREAKEAKKARKAQRASEPPKKLTDWDILCKRTLEVLKTIPKPDRRGVSSYLKIASELRKVQVVDPTLKDVKDAIKRVAGVTPAQEYLEELATKTSRFMKEIPSDEKLNITNIQVTKELQRLDVKEPTMKIVKANVNTLIGTNTTKINENRITGISYDEEDSLDGKQTTKYQPLEKSPAKNNGILKSIKRAFKRLLKKED